MEFIDTHSHLYLKEFDNDIHETIDRALDAGITKIVLPNIDSFSIGPLHYISDSYPDLFIPLMGLHPTSVRDNFEKELEIIFKQFKKYSYKGIGEIGLDHYWDLTFKDEQLAVFKKQLDFAVEMNLPVIIHARDSFREILNIIHLPEYSSLHGIFHAFTGDHSLAEEIIALGFKLGIGGIVTFKNSGLNEVVRLTDLEHLVLETDSPYLTPVPYRGKRNESSYLYFIAERIAEIKGVPVEEVAKITTRNAKVIFSI
jgi:TatD DNase family protein